MELPKLTRKQELFVHEYMIDLNATKAAERAGYSVKSCNKIGSQNLAKPAIKSYVDKMMAEKKDKLIASQDEILQFLTAVIRGEVTEFIPLLDGDGYQKIVEVTPNVQARRAAAELLGKRHMMWTDRHTVDMTAQVQIVDDIGDDDD